MLISVLKIMLYVSIHTKMADKLEIPSSSNYLLRLGVLCSVFCINLSRLSSDLKYKKYLIIVLRSFGKLIPRHSNDK